jgi:hypothetical protein
MADPDEQPPNQNKRENDPTMVVESGSCCSSIGRCSANNKDKRAIPEPPSTNDGTDDRCCDNSTNHKHPKMTDVEEEEECDVKNQDSPAAKDQESSSSKLQLVPTDEDRKLFNKYTHTHTYT